MNSDNLPKNGIPQELMNIPLGQIFILTNPSLGITPRNNQQAQFIFQMARQYGQGYLVNVLPVDYSGLWDCIACKAKTNDGYCVMVSDKDSLIEMLCELWGLDYGEICKTIKLPVWTNVTCGGVSHPNKTFIKPLFRSGNADGQEDPATLQVLHAHSREKTLGDIRSTFLDNFNYGFGISIDDIIALYKDVEANMVTYELDINVVWGTIIPKVKPVKIMKRCDISLIDNKGNKYPIKLQAECKAIYLTYFMFKDGLTFSDVSNSDEFYNVLEQIYKQIPRATGIPRRYNLEDKAQLDTYTNYISKIRRTIMAATNDRACVEKFAVEGYRKDLYKVAGATDDHRALIKKEFDIK